MIPKKMQRRLRGITLQGAIKKSAILLSQYWKNEWLDGNKIISCFGGSNSNFADCIAHQLERDNQGKDFDPSLYLVEWIRDFVCRFVPACIQILN